jgi:hypothetical protein
MVDCMIESSSVASKMVDCMIESSSVAEHTIAVDKKPK